MSENTGRSSQALRELIAKGVGASGNLVDVRPFRLSTMEEMLLQRNLMIAASGLDQTQFVENPWGFPFIPVPENRSSDPTRLIQAPVNLTWNEDDGRGGWSMLGHPIYWIDPELTSPTEDESSDLARWCVRMFYLIAAFGLWDDDLRWYDAPASAGVTYSRTDYENYLAGHSSALDRVRYTAEDLLVPYEKVLRSTTKAIDRMGDLQVREWTRYNMEQATAYLDAQVLLKSERWMKVEGEIADLSATIARRARKNEPVSDLVAPIYEAKNNLVDLLNDMERTNIMMAAANYRDLSANTTVYARVMTALNTYTERIVDGGYDKALEERIEELFSLDGALQARSFVSFHETATQFHTDSWRRLKLSAVNQARRDRGESPFGTYVEMETFEAAYSSGVDHFGEQTTAVEEEIDQEALDKLLNGEF